MRLPRAAAPPSPQVTQRCRPQSQAHPCRRTSQAAVQEVVGWGLEGTPAGAQLPSARATASPSCECRGGAFLSTWSRAACLRGREGRAERLRGAAPSPVCHRGHLKGTRWQERPCPPPTTLPASPQLGSPLSARRCSHSRSPPSSLPPLFPCSFHVKAPNPGFEPFLRQDPCARSSESKPHAPVKRPDLWLRFRKRSQLAAWHLNARPPDALREGKKPRGPRDTRAPQI